MVNQIIFISGWGTESSVWDSVLKPFTSKNRCASVSFSKPPNYQITKSPNGFMSNHRCAPIPWYDCLSGKLSNNLLFRLLVELNNPVILVGWSLGGMIALSGAIAFPEKVSGLVLISSSARMVHDKEYIGVNPRILKAMKFRLKTDKQGLLNDFAVMGILPAKNDPVQEDFVNKATAIDNDKLSEGLSYLQNCDLRDRLTNIRIPVNIVHGECDEIMNPANACYLGDNLLNADLNIVDGAGHFLIHSNPEIIIDSIKDLQRKV